MGGGGVRGAGDLATTGRGAEEVARYYEKHGYEPSLKVNFCHNITRHSL